jgi:hypothetical protein
LAGGAAKLLDAAEKLIHVAGIFAEEAGFEHQGIGCAGCVAHFSVANKALVCVHLDERAVLGSAREIGNANIRYFKFRWRGANVYIFLDLFVQIGQFQINSLFFEFFML